MRSRARAEVMRACAMQGAATFPQRSRAQTSRTFERAAATHAPLMSKRGFFEVGFGLPAPQHLPPSRNLAVKVATCIVAMCCVRRTRPLLRSLHPPRALARLLGEEQRFEKGADRPWTTHTSTRCAQTPWRVPSVTQRAGEQTIKHRRGRAAPRGSARQTACEKGNAQETKLAVFQHISHAARLQR